VSPTYSRRSREWLGANPAKPANPAMGITICVRFVADSHIFAGFAGFAGFAPSRRGTGDFGQVGGAHTMSDRPSSRGDLKTAVRQTRETPKPGGAFTWFIGLLDAAGSGPIGKNTSTRQCPAHHDEHPSLSISEAADGRVLLFCHGGCGWQTVLAALSLPPRYLHTPPPVAPADYARAFVRATFPPLATRPGRSPQAAGYRLAAIHDYGPQHRVLRWRKGTRKTLAWETLRGGCWLPGLFGTPTSALPLYREPDVRKAVALGEPVLLVESESSVDALSGWYATTWAGGASSVQISRLTQILGGYPHIVVVPDHDPAGLACLATLRAHRLAPHVLLPAAGEDARDLHTRVGTAAFTGMIKAAINSRNSHASGAS
jgi:hypothetical protein